MVEDIQEVIRYIRGDRDESAEDSFFEVQDLAVDDPESAWPIIVDVANHLADASDRTALGVGLLESFIRENGSTHAELIANSVLRSTSLIEAVRQVQTIGAHPGLKRRLSEVLGE